MRTQLNWMDEPEVFDMVSEALINGIRDDDQYDNVNISCRDEEDAYGDRGYVYITMPNGDRFSLTLNRES